MPGSVPNDYSLANCSICPCFLPNRDQPPESDYGVVWSSNRDHLYRHPLGSGLFPSLPTGMQVRCSLSCHLLNSGLVFTLPTCTMPPLIYCHLLDSGPVLKPPTCTIPSLTYCHLLDSGLVLNPPTCTIPPLTY